MAGQGIRIHTQIISSKKTKGSFEVQYFADKPILEVQEKDLFNFEEHYDVYEPTEEIIRKNRKLARAMEEVAEFKDSRASRR